MQNKKSLLQRLMVIYITFFFVLIVGMTHSIIPSFSKGLNAGEEIGIEMVKNYTSNDPHRIYMLGNIPAREKEFEEIPVTAPGILSTRVATSNISLVVEEPAHGESVITLAFSSLGGSPWLYFAALLIPILYLATIVMMILIINSLRRSIREECTLESRNVWRLRLIGGLTIAAELLQDLLNWRMAARAAELLADSRYEVMTGFQVNYSMIIMGILVIFAAEVFAIGRNLSEEQKLTI